MSPPFIVGRDIEDRPELACVIRSAMSWTLGVMALFGIGGGYLAGPNLLARIDVVAATSRTTAAGDLTGRCAKNGFGDGALLPAAEPQPHAAPAL